MAALFVLKFYKSGPYIKGCGSVTIIINKIKKSTFLIIIGTKFIQAILHKAYN